MIDDDASLAPRKLERDSLHHQVYRRLCETIMTGGLKPGAEVTLRALADAMGTSEMPVRDAVRRLIAEKALEFRPGRRFGVPTLTAEQYREILHVRLLLEKEAARAAARRIAPGELAVMHEIQAEMVALGGAAENRGKLWTLNRRFHFAIYKAAQLPLMTSFIEMLWLQIGPLFSNMSVDIGMRDSPAYHSHIIAAMERHDPDAAERGVEADLSSAATLIIAALEAQERTPPATPGLPLKVVGGGRKAT